jgi:uncharacterized protein YueI
VVAMGAAAVEGRRSAHYVGSFQERVVGSFWPY